MARTSLYRTLATTAAVGAVALGLAAPAAAAPAATPDGGVHTQSWYADGSRYCPAGQNMWIGFEAAGKITVEWTPTDWYDPHVRSVVAQDNPFVQHGRVNTDVQGGLWRIRASQSTQPSQIVDIHWANADCY